MSSPFQHPEIGAKIIDQVTGQADMLHTMAVSALGATVALLWTVVQHQHAGGEARPIVLRRRKQLVAGIVCLGASVGLCYMVRGELLSAVPRLMGLPFNPKTPFDKMQCAYPEGWQLAGLAALQALSFCAGVGLVGYAFLRDFFELLPVPSAKPARPLTTPPDS